MSLTVIESCLDALGVPISRIPLILALFTLLATVWPDDSSVSVLGAEAAPSDASPVFPVAKYEFEKDDLHTSWISVDDPHILASSYSSSWTHVNVGGGRMQQLADVGPLGAEYRGTILRRAISERGRTWGDATLTSKFGFGTSGLPGGAGVVFRLVDDSTYYRVLLSLWSNVIILDKFVAGVRISVESGLWDASKYAVGSDIELSVRASGPRITVFISHPNDPKSGMEKIRIIDTIEASYQASAEGTIGLFASGAAEATFDYVRVTPNPNAVLIQSPLDGILSAYAKGATVSFHASLADCDPSFPLTSSGRRPDSSEPIPGIRVTASARGESASLSRAYSEATILRCGTNSTFSVEPRNVLGVTSIGLQMQGAASLWPWSKTGGTVTKVEKRVSGQDVLVTTSEAHNIIRGDRVRVVSMLSIPEINGREFEVGSVPSGSTFSLRGIDGAAWGTTWDK